MSTPAQVQPDWFDANGQPISPQPTGNQATQTQTADDWFSQNAPSSQDDQVRTRMMALSGLTGMPTPNMTDQEKQSYAHGKATGYFSGMAAGAIGGLAGSAPADAAIYEAAKAYGYGSEAIKDALTSPMGRYILKRALDLGVASGGFKFAVEMLKRAGAFNSK